MEIKQDPKVLFNKQLTELSKLHKQDQFHYLLNPQFLEKWGLYKIYINEYGSLKRKTNFQSDIHDNDENNDWPPAMGSYFTDEFLIKVPNNQLFASTLCWLRGIKNKRVTQFSISPNDRYLVSVLQQCYWSDSWADYPLLGLCLVNLQTKDTQEVALPSQIPSTNLEIKEEQDALNLVNEGYSLTHYSSNKTYCLTNGKILALAVSDDGNKIALANNSLIGIMERNNQKWYFRIIKQLASEKVEQLKKEGEAPKPVYWPQKVAFLSFNEEASELGVGYYAKNPKPLSWRKWEGYNHTAIVPQEVETIGLDAPKGSNDI